MARGNMKKDKKKDKNKEEMKGFNALSPIKDADINGYKSALEYVCSNDDIRNVAVSGPFCFHTFCGRRGRGLLPDRSLFPRRRSRRR